MSRLIKLCLAAILSLSFISPAFAGGVAVIGVEGPTQTIDQITAANFLAAARDYLARNADVATSAYGQSYQGAWQHYVEHGQYEGRVWNQSQTQTIFSQCGEHNCVHFPDGAKIGAISWQSAVKVGNSDVLFVLYASNGMSLLQTYQKGISNVVRDIVLPDPIEIPPGGFVWVYADGWGDASSGGVEIQTALYLLGNPRVTQ